MRYDLNYQQVMRKMSKQNKFKLFSILLIVIINIFDINCIERESEELVVENVNSTTTTNTTEAVINNTSAGVEVEGNKQLEILPPEPIPYNERELNCNKITEIEHNCSNTCPGSCEDPDKPACRDNYCWRACECKPGYVKDHQNWTCIPIENCPKCAENEHFRDCGAACQPTCSNYQNTPPHCNSKYSCERGCFCDYGFVRDMSKNGTCVSINACPQKCGQNEYYDESGPPCVRTAANPRPKCLDEVPVPTCVCNTGFIRNPKTGQCERLSTFVEKCGGNETFSFCGTECSKKCFDNTKRQFCPTVCLRGCFCNEGYVRDPHNEKCVFPKDCYVWRPNVEN